MRAKAAKMWFLMIFKGPGLWIYSVLNYVKYFITVRCTAYGYFMLKFNLNDFAQYVKQYHIQTKFVEIFLHLC